VLITDTGKQRLGALLKACREQRDWSIDDVIREIHAATGYKPAKSTISNLERGHSTPTWDTLALIAAIRYVYLPGVNFPLTAHAMLDIASETIDPGNPDTYQGRIKAVNATPPTKSRVAETPATYHYDFSFG
jgi:transcriptional regulator with XRE-family HTH domain